MLILGIESSCDETGLALYEGPAPNVLTDAAPERPADQPLQAGQLLGSVLHSQIELHNRYGGVVPELASRDHIQRMTPLLNELLSNCNRALEDLDAIAYTSGPGLLGALLVGASFGRTLAFSLGIPALGIHHMEGHLLAPLLPDTAPDREGPEIAGQAEKLSPPSMPFTALLVSGGHTQLIDVAELGRYELLGESVDDAAGEAFDKTAKLLELGYPGGPALAKIAEQGDPARFTFPRPMTDRPGCNFSFSGLKTFARTTISKLAATGPLSDQDKADVARAFEDAVVDTLTIKCRRALEQTGHNTLLVAGGVGANKHLRQTLRKKLKADVHFPPLELCTDNGAMIAYAGWLRLRAGAMEPLAIRTRARWPLAELSPPAPPAEESQAAALSLTSGP